MKRTTLLCMLAVLSIPVSVSAQEAPSNPVTDAAKQMHARFGSFLMAAADEVPESMLSYKPTEAQMSFGTVWAHLAGANRAICSAIGGMAAPDTPERHGTEDKATLVKELKDSFAFCDRAFAATDDGDLGATVDMGFMKGTRAMAMFVYVEDLADHYSQVANYMRLNDMLPPSAKGRGD
ncbi:MAG: DinB family protein [Gemmatimonadales bacterium]|jgi:hypothetical protein